MITFKDWFFNQFPETAREEDTNKNDNGEGTFQRYLQSMGVELDDNIIPFISALTDVYDALKCPPSLLNHLGSNLGYIPSLDSSPETYAKLLPIAIKIFKTKGTLQSYKDYFGILGVDVDILELTPKTEITYDQKLPIYDDEPDEEEYDSECEACSGYYLKMGLKSFGDLTNGKSAEASIPLFPFAGAGYTMGVYVIPPIGGALGIASYTVQSTDTTPAILGQSIVNYINTHNIGGYTARVSSFLPHNQISIIITAPSTDGASMNGHVAFINYPGGQSSYPFSGGIDPQLNYAIIPDEIKDKIENNICFLQPINAKFMGFINSITFEETINITITDTTNL